MLLAGTAWARVVLTDEGRYIRAVSALPGSPRFARLAGTTVSLAVRHHVGWRRRLARITARAAGRATTHTMGTTAFRRSWTVSHRVLYRHRPPQWRVAISMVALATMGTVVAAGSQLNGRMRNGPTTKRTAPYSGT